jgi:putative phage-type endonuclease
MIQGSPEWHEARRGFLGASAINDARSVIKSGEAASRRNLRAKIIAERLTGICEESYTNSAMQWGIDNEPIARALYETTIGSDVDQCGFILHPEIKMTGASPDGLIGNDGLIEIKCPNTATHIDYLLAGIVPTQYRNQMLWQMECTGREWCDFVSYDPRMPEHMQMFCIRFNRDEDELNEIREDVIKFLDEVNAVIDRLQIISQQRK